MSVNKKFNQATPVGYLQPSRRSMMEPVCKNS